MQHEKTPAREGFWQRLLKSLSLYDLMCGLRLTAGYAFSKAVTLSYPERKTPKSPRMRGLHVLRRYANGEERCIACKLCEATCPALAITIESAPREDGQRRTTRYEIDMFKCIYCGLCEEACPVDAIVQSSETEYSFLGRGDNILDKQTLLALGDRLEERIAADRAEDAAYR